MPSGRPRGLGPRALEKLESAYPGWQEDGTIDDLADSELGGHRDGSKPPLSAERLAPYFTGVRPPVDQAQSSQLIQLLTALNPTQRAVVRALLLDILNNPTYTAAPIKQTA